MQYFWDIVSVIILIIAVYVGVKRGFIRTLITAASYVIAFVVSNIFSSKVATWVFEKYFYSRITDVVSTQINLALNDKTATGKEIIASLPQWIASLINEVAPEFEQTLSELVKGMVSEERVLEISKQVTDSLSPMVIEVLSWFIFIIMFIVLLWVLKFVARAFTGINRIPIVGGANMILGGVTGVVVGIVWIAAISMIASFVGSILGDPDSILSSETVYSSLIMGTMKKIFLS